jgi:hypothetical protein
MKPSAVFGAELAKLFVAVHSQTIIQGQGDTDIGEISGSVLRIVNELPTAYSYSYSLYIVYSLILLVVSS